MENEILNNLRKISSSFYNEKDDNFCSKLAGEIQKLNFDESSVATAYFIRANTRDSAFRNALTAAYKITVIENIELLQRLGSISFPETQKNISGLRKLFIELTDDVRIIFIKLAERLINLKDADEQKSENIELLSEEALYFYSPIAQQLGIRKFYTELEDIAFKNLYREDFKYLEKMIESRRNIFTAKLKTKKLD